MRALEGQVALVTGSTRGIGWAIAERFAAEGARLVVHGRTQADCERCARELGGDCIGLAADVSHSDQAGELIRRTLDHWGRLDVLVNNAGIARDRYVTRLTDTDWNDTLATNLSGPFYLIRAAVPAMKSQEAGSIVNVLSWAGVRGNVGQAAYSASKAGLYGLTLSMAKELAKFGIRVNALSPAMATEMTDQMNDEIREKSLKRKLLRRRGEPEEIAEAALFLASDRSSYTTGQLLHVDGGMHLL